MKRALSLLLLLAALLVLSLFTPRRPVNRAAAIQYTPLRAIRANTNFSREFDPLIGIWVNDDPKPDIAQVNVRRDGVRILVHAWGACSAADCDWGEEVVELQKGIGAVIWDQGFVRRNMKLTPLPYGKLRVAVSSEYHDNSGRTDRSDLEFLSRWIEPKDNASSSAARAILKQVADT